MQSHSWAYIWRKHGSKRHMNPTVHCSAIYNRQGTEATLKCINQFSLVAQSCLTLCDPMNCSTPGLPVYHQLPESAQVSLSLFNQVIPTSPFSSSQPPPYNMVLTCPVSYRAQSLRSNLPPILIAFLLRKSVSAMFIFSILR